MTDFPDYYVSAAGYVALMDWYARALAAIRVPVNTCRVPTRYGITHVIQSGPPDAPPVLLLHGINTSAMSWRLQIEGLANNFRVIAPDIVGFTGRSGSTRLPYHDASYARWAVDVLDALDIPAAHVVGGSAGGHFALKLAAWSPERVLRLALLNPCGLAGYRFPYGVTRVHGVPALLNWLNYRVLASPRLARILVHKGVAPGLPLDPDWIEFSYLILRHYRRHAPPGILRADELRRIQSKTLLLVGEYEVFHRPNDIIRRARTHLASLTAERVSAAGHDMQRDRAVWINRRLAAFLCAEERTPVF
jgi:pimeloyl-ACP methyl ester carboxylesterase